MVPFVDEEDDEADFEAADSSEEEDFESDDSDGYGKKKKKKASKGKGKMAPPPIRFASRSTTTPKFYDESGDDDDEEMGSETESEEERKRAKIKVLNAEYNVEVDGWAIEGVFDRQVMQLKEEDGTEYNDIQYLVKWRGFSHRHNSWNNMQHYRDFKGYRKVENFARKWKLDEDFKKHPHTTEYEIEALNDEIERERSLVEDYKIVERIVAMRDVEPGSFGNENGGTEYLCKWYRLSYGECTWESADNMLPEDQVEIDAFLNRNQTQLVPHKSDTYLRHRVSYKPFQKQPEYLDVGGTLRDYQLLGVNWMAHLWHNNLNGILADEMVS